MLTLYHCAGARSFRVLWALEELELAYTLIAMPFPPRTRQEGYLAVNPLGTVPALLDDGNLLTESSAIPHYLATRYGPAAFAVAPDEPAYGAYVNFLFMGEATLTFPQTIYLRYTALEPPERLLPQAAADYARWFGSRARAAMALMGADYAAAGRFTMADISMGYAVKLAGAIGLQVPDRAREYWQRLRQRPALLRAEAAEREAVATGG